MLLVVPLVGRECDRQHRHSMGLGSDHLDIPLLLFVVSNSVCFGFVVANDSYEFQMGRLRDQI